MSPFVFTGNNPIMLVDPDGKSPICEGCPEGPEWDSFRKDATMWEYDAQRDVAATWSDSEAIVGAPKSNGVGSGNSPVNGNGVGEGGPAGQGGTISLLDGAPSQDFGGFWGGVKYFWTGGNIDGYHYNMDGKATGLAPIMGMPPSFIGGPLRKGEQALKLGKYLFNPSAFHAVKKGVLSFANPKSFSHIVGTNPDLMFKGGKIWLTGTKTGGYFGKSYETGMTIADFLKLF